MFNNILGQEKLKRFLKHQIDTDTLSYGYIFCGDRYMGKNFIAHEIAEEITVDSYIIDVLPSEGRKLIQVDDIRALKESVYGSTFKGEKKVYIIPNSEKMTSSAQNAFLKILEEPPREVIFIMLIENTDRLIETVRSRCTVLKLERYSDKDIVNYLKTLDIESNPEKIKLCNGTLNKYMILNSKEFAPVMELSDKILFNIQKLHPARVFAITKHLRKQKEHIYDILDLFLVFYRDIYIYKILQSDKYLEFSSKISHIKEQASSYTEEEVLGILDRILMSKRKLELNSNFDMTVEMLLLTMRGLI